MKFECGDLDRALANPSLLPEAREHLKTCARCRKEYQLWADISATAQELHQEWQTPDLWPRISQQLRSEARRKPIPTNYWRMGIAAAALVFAALWLHHRTPNSVNTPPTAVSSPDQDFLTEQALREVETSEAAYRKSIDQLARLAEPKLKNSSSAASVNTQEKLLMLDAAIADTRNSVASNRFNLHLQTTLADLYRAKQQTLKELLTIDQTN